MRSEDTVLRSQHGMNGMPQFVRHGCNIFGMTLVVQLHPGGQVGEGGEAEGAPAFAAADFPVQVVLSKHTLGLLGKGRVKLAERAEYHISSFAKGILLFGSGDRGINIIAAQPLHAHPARFELEIALEGAHIALADLQQGVDHFIRDIIDQVAGRDGAGKLAQGHLLIAPVACNRLVHLPQDGAIRAIDPV